MPTLPNKIIDIHTHLFNARCLPLPGIIEYIRNRGTGNGWIARLDKIIFFSNRSATKTSEVLQKENLKNNYLKKYGCIYIGIILAGAPAQMVYAGQKLVEITSLTLVPIGAGNLSNALGVNDIISGSKFYQEMIKPQWNMPIAEPILVNGAITNIEDLIPKELIIVPNILTIHSTYQLGTKEDYKRMSIGGVPKLPIVSPANESIFYFGINSKGSLINPLFKSTNPSSKGYLSIFKVKVFGSQFNEGDFSAPLSAAREANGVTDYYDQMHPQENPPNSLMVKGRTPGKYSLTLSVKLNENYFMSDADKKIAEKGVLTKSFEVNVLDGTEIIDNLLVNVSPKLTDISTPQKERIILKDKESFDLDLSGLIYQVEWKSASNKYESTTTKVVTLNEAHWTYENNITQPPMIKEPFVTIKKITSDGTSVRITGKKPSGASKNSTGNLFIKTHGKLFQIGIIVLP